VTAVGKIAPETAAHIAAREALTGLGLSPGRRARCTLTAQALTCVVIDEGTVKRLPLDPAAPGPCGDCGCVPGQLHWPLCDQEACAVDGGQLIGRPVILTDFVPDRGGTYGR